VPFRHRRCGAARGRAWRVVEIGDGQVSDLHPNADVAVLARLLVTA
jgi:hypothetical protein